MELAAELELHSSRQDDEELLRVSVRVRLLPRGATLVELADEHLEVVEWTRREQPLRAEHAEGERRSIVASEHLGSRRPPRIEQVGHSHTECAGDPAERRDARARPAPLDLAQEALAHTRALRDRPQRGASQAANVSQALADVDFGDLFGRARGNQISLDPIEGKLKRPYGLDEVVSTSYSVDTVRPLRVLRLLKRGPARVASGLARRVGRAVTGVARTAASIVRR
jgi:hypothetical protein